MIYTKERSRNRNFRYGFPFFGLRTEFQLDSTKRPPPILHIHKYMSYKLCHSHWIGRILRCNGKRTSSAITDRYELTTSLKVVSNGVFEKKVRFFLTKVCIDVKNATARRYGNYSANHYADSYLTVCWKVSSKGFLASNYPRQKSQIIPEHKR